MTLIDSRCAIFNMLALCSSFELSRLHYFAVALKRRMHDAYVDISDNAVLGTIESYPSLLSLEEDVISRSESFGAFAEQTFVDETINRIFAPYIREHLHASAEDALKEVFSR